MRKVFLPENRERPGVLVLSGLDGTGKSTQASILADRLRQEGIKVDTIWNRWKPCLSAPAIRLARRRINPAKDAALSDYENFTETKRKKMRNPLKRSLWQLLVWSEYALQVNWRLRTHRYPLRGIICDRYVYDTLIDMAINFSLGEEELPQLCSHPLLGLFPRPGCVILIDIDPQTGAERKKDGTPASYLSDRRKLYLALAGIMDAPVVNGERSIDEIADELWEITGPWRKRLIRKNS
ncbi:MAG: hypothetical protein JXB45_00500 [Candidatus Krumholzibacteriota bacterium]|nr:hypothetical protein [Candidatus Krumholzibacteriota bacterium]